MSRVPPLMLSPAIAELKAYVPGKPISETQRETGLKDIIKLASNENPLGPSKMALAAIRRRLTDLHRYPDASGFELKRQLAHKFKLLSDQIVLGNGSDDLIECLVRAFCVPSASPGHGDSVACPQLSFSAYSVCAQAHGVRVVHTAIDATSFVPDVDALITRVREDHKIKLVFLANPNNPTGARVSGAEMRKLAQAIAGLPNRRVLLVLDDAYGEFVTARDHLPALDLWREFPEHVVVLRTFSKVYGLGGLRVGYSVACAEISAVLNRVRQPFNVSSLALAGAEGALKDVAFVRRSLAANRQGMRYLVKEFKRLKVSFLPSEGNFLLVECQARFGLSGPEFAASMLRSGIILRPIANYGETRYVRVSVGRMAENRRLIQVLSRLSGRNAEKARV